jgi:hypothetical protein
LSALHRTHPHPYQIVQIAQYYPSPNRPSAILASVVREPVLRPCMRGPYTREHYTTAPYPSTNHCFHRGAQARRRGTQVKLARAPSSNLKLSFSPPSSTKLAKPIHNLTRQQQQTTTNLPTHYPRTLPTNPPSFTTHSEKPQHVPMPHSLTRPSIHPSIHLRSTFPEPAPNRADSPPPSPSRDTNLISLHTPSPHADEPVSSSCSAIVGTSSSQCRGRGG